MNREQLKEALARHMIRPQRSLGQNFLVQASVIKKIIAATGAGKQDLLLEIGPGAGALSLDLAATAGQLIALEIDQRLLPLLQERLAGSENSRLIQADALQIDLAALVEDWPGPILVTASLPYYITSPLVEKLICELPACRQFCLLIQKEAGERLMARPGSKEYGPTAILLALAGRTKRLFHVPGSAFYPQPHITSSLIKTQVFPAAESLLPQEPGQRRLFLTFLKDCFAQRRKKLAPKLPPGLINQAGLAENARAEELSPLDYVKLWQLLYPAG